MVIFVKVTPNAPHNRIEEMRDGVLYVKIHAPPYKGKANEALLEFLAETLRIPRRKVRIVSGYSSRLKRIEIDAEFDKSIFNA